MATYTSFLHLEKPTTSERLDVLKINANWDAIDSGVSALNSQIGGLTAKYGTFTHSVTATAKGNIYGDTSDVDIDIGVPSGKTIRAISIFPNSDHTVWVGRTAVSGNKINRMYIYSASALSAVNVTFSYMCWYS